MGMGGVSAGSENEKMGVSEVKEIFLLTEKYYTFYNTPYNTKHVWLHNALFLSQNLSVSAQKWVRLTCICQAVIGGGGGQHLPAPISTVLDAAVCTFYCKTESESLLVEEREDICWAYEIKGALCYCCLFLAVESNSYQSLFVANQCVRPLKLISAWLTETAGVPNIFYSRCRQCGKRKRTGWQIPAFTLNSRSLKTKNMTQIYAKIPTH